MRGLVFSDLHLFSPRSCAEVYLEMLHKQLESSDVAVLNGDIFDFRWSEYPDHEATQNAAADWITSLCNAHPHCQFHYVVGNHDCLTPFLKTLQELQSGCPNFQWHELSLHLAGNLFLHGDCAHRKMTPAKFACYRRVWSQHEQKPVYLAPLCQFSDLTRFTHLAHKFLFRPQPTLDRLTYFLDRSLPDWRKDTRHCFFGHTHSAFTNRMDGDVHFHNTGSAVHDREFLPLKFDLENPDNPSSPQPVTL